MSANSKLLRMDAASGREAGVPTPFPFVAEVRRCLIPARKLEREPVFEQSRGDNAAALARLPAEDDDIMAIAVKCTRQDCSDLS